MNIWAVLIIAGLCSLMWAWPWKCLGRLWRFFRIPSQRTVRYYADEFTRLKSEAARQGFAMTGSVSQHGNYELTKNGATWYFHRLSDIPDFIDLAKTSPGWQPVGDYAVDTTGNIVKIDFVKGEKI